MSDIVAGCGVRTARYTPRRMTMVKTAVPSRSHQHQPPANDPAFIRAYQGRFVVFDPSCLLQGFSNEF